MAMARFYYADERQENGDAVYTKIDGPAAAEAYVHLAEVDQQQQWYYTFVKGSAKYVDFGDPTL